MVWVKCMQASVESAYVLLTELARFGINCRLMQCFYLSHCLKNIYITLPLTKIICGNYVVTVAVFFLMFINYHV